jgi:hypothetical protein
LDGQQVAQGRIKRTIRARFSLDETFDVGEDTGTPVIEDYAAQMPFKFTGTLEKVTIDLAPQNLSAKEQREDRGERDGSGAGCGMSRRRWSAPAAGPCRKPGSTERGRDNDHKAD